MMKQFCFIFFVAIVGSFGVVLGFDQADFATFRANISCPQCDLSGIDIPGQIFEGADLRGANLKGARLGSIDRMAAGASFLRADLSGANLEQAYFKEADLTGALLVNANMVNANFQGALLTGADLSGADLTGTLFRNADLIEARFDSRTKVKGADFGQAKLFFVSFEGKEQESAEFKAWLQKNGATYSTEEDLQEQSKKMLASLEQKKSCPGCILAYLNLSGARLSGIDLTGANLRSATLINAVLEKA
ncbi:MAG: pentapeptide repeat-containing protein, partial [Hydrogenophaga sp.]|nr:pentapeptide repeat-containing protein [Hydrogenophaga sp.]